MRSSGKKGRESFGSRSLSLTGGVRSFFQPSRSRRSGASGLSGEFDRFVAGRSKPVKKGEGKDGEWSFMMEDNTKLPGYPEFTDGVSFVLSTLFAGEGCDIFILANHGCYIHNCKDD
ncbi:hypothetical protein BOX30_01865 [Leptospirillum ferriphilum]|nr:hypothetical protein BOX30_01865 [Leptospirillum ferriphilum]